MDKLKLKYTTIELDQMNIGELALRLTMATERKVDARNNLGGDSKEYRMEVKNETHIITEIKNRAYNKNGGDALVK